MEADIIKEERMQENCSIPWFCTHRIVSEMEMSTVTTGEKSSQISINMIETLCYVILFAFSIQFSITPCFYYHT